MSQLVALETDFISPLSGCIMKQYSVVVLVSVEIGLNQIVELAYEVLDRFQLLETWGINIGRAFRFNACSMIMNNLPSLGYLMSTSTCKKSL
jgi:hypothetical protein